MTERWHCAVRDEIGTIYGSKLAVVEASGPVEAAMNFFREYGQFPTEIEKLWHVEGGELHVGVRAGDVLGRVKVLQDESNQLQEVIRAQRDRLKVLLREVDAAQLETKFYRHHYLKLGKYLESVVTNTKTVWGSVDAGLQNALLRMENRPATRVLVDDEDDE